MELVHPPLYGFAGFGLAFILLAGIVVANFQSHRKR